MHGKMAHAAIPATGVDALQGAVEILNALYAQNDLYRGVTSQVAGITHPYLNVGTIAGGTNTNVVPGKVVLRLDRRMIPEEDPVAVEASLREVIAAAAARRPGISVEVRRLLLARALKPLPGNAALVAALQKHGEAVFGVPIPESGTPLYTDVRLYGEAGVPAAIYGAGPRTVLESNAKRADEHLELDDLRRATKVVARTLRELLSGSEPALGGAAGSLAPTRERAERCQAAGEQRPRLGLRHGGDRERVGDDAMGCRGRMNAVPVGVLVAIRADDGAARVADVGEAEERRIRRDLRAEAEEVEGRDARLAGQAGRERDVHRSPSGWWRGRPWRGLRPSRPARGRGSARPRR